MKATPRPVGGTGRGVMVAMNVLAAWSGLRPLVLDPKTADTAQLSRDHVVHVADSGLVTIAGDKWTTYRRMAAARTAAPRVSAILAEELGWDAARTAAETEAALAWVS